MAVTGWFAFFVFKLPAACTGLITLEEDGSWK